MEELSHLVVPEFAAAARVEPATVTQWIRQGRLKAVKPGRDWLIPKSELDRMLTSVEVAE